MIKDYTIDIGYPVSVSSIIQNDLWVFENFTRDLLNDIVHPVKFSAYTSIFVKKGSCTAQINLINHEIKSPCVVNIRDTQILVPTHISDDFEASCLVISNSIAGRIFSLFSNTPYSTLIRRFPIVKLPEEITGKLHDFYKFCSSLLEGNNQNAEDCLVYSIMAFFYNYISLYYDSLKDTLTTPPGRLTERFIALVQDNFKKERFLDFYASQLDITSKHLSRSIKQQTGCTAVEWIDKFVILEAQALLKSSNLNIQQIADELNFPSQSFFGKYFKKHTGLSPKEFRNK